MKTRAVAAAIPAAEDRWWRNYPGSLGPGHRRGVRLWTRSAGAWEASPTFPANTEGDLSALLEAARLRNHGRVVELRLDTEAGPSGQ